MSYTAPSITASGTTFAQMVSSGASGHLERIITANSFSAEQIRLLRAVKVGRLDIIYQKLAQFIRTWDEGDPIANTTAAKARLTDLHTVFAVLNTLCTEAGVLIDGNAGTLGTAATGIGGRIGHRTFP
jgi:hypothetical protein